MLSSHLHNCDLYCFRDIRSERTKIYAKNFGFGGSPRGTAPKRREDLSWTDMYHHAKFHAEISVTGQRNKKTQQT